MRNKFIVFWIITAASLVVFAQTNLKIRYWFDYDPTNIHIIESSTKDIHLDADISESSSFSAVYLQVVDGDKESSPQTGYFINCAYKNQGLRYWFDNNTNFITVEGSISNTPIDVSSLEEGLHNIHIQTLGDLASSIQTRLFVKSVSLKDGNISYWFDDQIDQSYTLKGNIVDDDIDVSHLSDGLHSIHVLYGVSDPLTVETRSFFKVPSFTGNGDSYLISYIDNEFYSKQKVDASNGIIHLDIDVTSLTSDLHPYIIQLLTSTGTLSATAHSFFYRVPTTEEIDGMECFYTLGESDIKHQAGSYSKGTFHFNIDVSEMPEGLQRVSAFLCNDKGLFTNARTAFFTKIPLGGNGISQYAYWVNDDEENMEIVKVDDSSVIQHLSKLIPVESHPLSSKRFHFEINDAGIPTIYAKNQFNILIFDHSYRCSRDSAEYIDVNVSREITEIEPIKSNVPKTKTIPSENEIHWFKTEALAGDSMAIKSSSACMMEIFSPLGDRLYEVSGKSSTTLKGCRAVEDGTYYIALHDMETQKSGNVTLTYQLFDKLPRGDANGDGLINVTDVTTTIDEILEKKPANFVFVGADVDRDKEISIADVSLITVLILGNDISSFLNSMRVAPLGEYYPSLVSVEDFIIRNNHDETLYIKVEDYDNLIAAQLDLHQPEGLSISDIALVDENSTSHSIVWRRLGQGNDYRLIAFSMGNQSFVSSDIIAVTIHADENAAVDGTNVILNNIVLNSYDEQHSIIKQQFVADTMCSVYGDRTSTAQVDNDEWNFRVEGLRLYIMVPSSCTKVMTDTLGRFCVLYLNEGENVVDMLSTGVYILDGKKIIVK